MKHKLKRGVKHKSFAESQIKYQKTQSSVSVVIELKSFLNETQVKLKPDQTITISNWFS